MRDRAGRLAQNLRYALRQLARNPSFTLAAVASLGLGIAVNTTMFSVVSSMLLRPLGAGGEHLVRIGRSNRGERAFRTAEYSEFLYLREHAKSFTSVVGHDLVSARWGAGESATNLSAEVVAGTYFGTLDVIPTIGRAFDAEEDRAPGQSPVAVISDRFWRRTFSVDSGATVLGRRLTLNGQPFTIIGVAPRGFTGTFPGVDIDLWLPAGMAWVTQTGSDRSGLPSLLLIGRLAKGVSQAAAEAELAVLSRQMAADSPTPTAARTFVVARARGAHPLIASVLRVFLSMLMAVVGVVLLIACANVAGLLLSRAAARRREIAVRLALGANRLQLVGLLLMESLPLALLGGLVGVALAVWPLRFLSTLAFIPGPTGTPVFLDLRLDVRVLAFTAAASMSTVLVFGLVPALQATRVDIATALQHPRVGGDLGPSRFRLGSALVAVQVCVSFALLVGATLLFRSLQNTRRVEMGFDPERVFVATVDLERLGYDRPRADRFYAELLAKARSLPMVEGAALANFVPLGDGRGHPSPLMVAGVEPPAGQRRLEVGTASVSDEYFATLRQRLTRGREFKAADSSRPVAIVNDAMARRYWPGRDPIGMRFGLGEGFLEREVIGVVASARYASFGGVIEPLVYLPAFTASRLHLRVNGSANDVLRSVRGLVREIDASAVPYVSARGMRESMESSLSLVPAKIARGVLSAAGLIALILAAGGLYALVSYTVQQRMKEIGIRVALGANRAGVFRVVVGRALRLTVLGLVIGAGVAAGGAQVLSSLLYGLSPIDPVTFFGIASLLVLVALGAGYGAARRGLGVDPIVILRYE